MKKSFIIYVPLFALLCLRLPASSLAAQTPCPLRQEPQTYTNSIGMEFVRIPAGSFTRTFTTKNDAGEEMKTLSKVIISKAFYLGKYLVTQEQWAAVMKKNFSAFKGQSNPVDSVSWNDAQEFIKRLNASEKCEGYRLPTEAEWELAARGGTDTPLFFMQNPLAWEKAADDLDAYAWFAKNAGDKTHPVGQKKPNPYGLYDIYGNVWEWVQDGFTELSNAPEVKDYLGQAEDSLRVLRGACWICAPEVIRMGSRRNAPAERGDKHMGFRLAISPE